MSTSVKPPIVVTATSAPFWDGIKAGRLMLQVDPTTGRWQFYPRTLSLTSEGPLEWREASGRGTLAAVTLTHFPSPGFDPSEPYLEGLVQLDEGPRIFTPICGAQLEQLAVGRRMRIVFGEGGHLFQFTPDGPAADSQISKPSKDTP